MRKLFYAGKRNVAQFARDMFYTQDRPLMIGMLTTLAMLALLFAVFVWLFTVIGVPWYMVVLVAAIVCVVQYYMSDRMILKSMGAREISYEEWPALHAMIERLAALADVPMPKKVAIIPTDVPNACAAGRNPKNAVIAVTSGLVRRLNDREIEAVLAHEIGHIKNRDIMVMNCAHLLLYLTGKTLLVLKWSLVALAAIVATLWAMGQRNSAFYLGLAVLGLIIGLYMVAAYIAMLAIQFIANLLVLALTRCREYSADRMGATLVGAPFHLASALQKISDDISRTPDSDLRRLQTANAFLIIPALKRNKLIMALYSTHPAPDKRIRRLMNMQRAMDRVDGRE